MADEPQPPPFLSPSAQAEWFVVREQLRQRGTLDQTSPIDVDHYAMLFDALAAAAEDATTNGPTIVCRNDKGEVTKVQANPTVAQMRSLRKDLVELADRLGLREAPGDHESEGTDADGQAEKAEEKKDDVEPRDGAEEPVDVDARLARLLEAAADGGDAGAD